MVITTSQYVQISHRDYTITLQCCSVAVSQFNQTYSNSIHPHNHINLNPACLGLGLSVATPRFKAALIAIAQAFGEVRENVATDIPRLTTTKPSAFPTEFLQGIATSMTSNTVMHTHTDQGYPISLSRMKHQIMASGEKASYGHRNGTHNDAPQLELEG